MLLLKFVLLLVLLLLLLLNRPFISWSVEGATFNFPQTIIFNLTRSLLGQPKGRGQQGWPLGRLADGAGFASSCDHHTWFEKANQHFEAWNSSASNILDQQGIPSFKDSRSYFQQQILTDTIYWQLIYCNFIIGPSLLVGAVMTYPAKLRMLFCRTAL